jgi:DNA-binding MarR family transcriptional regulator
MAETSKKTIKTADTVALADRLRPVLLRIGRELRREASAVGISPGQVTLLVAIKYAPGIGVNELAERERMSPAGMSGHVERLVKAGYVTRTPNESDRRRIGLTLTEEGKRILRNVRSRRTVWLARRLGHLGPDELAAIDAAIEPLTLLLDEDERP